MTNDHNCDINEIVALVDVSDFGCPFRITSLKQGMRNPDRVNVFVNGRFEFALDITQVVEFRLKVGCEITKNELEKYRKASEFGKLYQRALEKALMRPRSEREIRDYLRKKVYEKKLDEDYIGDIVEKLKNKRYIDDRIFAEWYVENKFTKKGTSKKRLEMELMRKGVPKDIICAVLKKWNDREEILKVIAKKRVRYDDEGLIRYLCRQGFVYEMVQNLVRTYEKD